MVHAVSVEPPSRGEFAGASWFFTSEVSEGSIQVDAALGGAHAGIDRGPLFIIDFRAVGTPDGLSSALQLELLHARDGDNHPVSGLECDPGRIVVDLQAPSISLVQITNETLAHTDDFAKDGDLVAVTAQISDGHPDFTRGDIRGVGAPIWGAPWVFGPPDSYDGQTALWSARPVLTNPVGNGDRAFQVSAIDPAGNSATISEDIITIDNIAPEPIDGLTATAGHNQIALAWNDPAGGDLHPRHTVVRARPWGDHPFYATPAPDDPTGPAEGDSVYTGTDLNVIQSFAGDGSQRDILYYGVMAEDMAGNVSPATTARTTSYRVGDVDAQQDGAIDAADLSRLDASLGRASGDAAFDPWCDVAPADSSGPVIPQPDGLVDLDDLMLLSMRHDHQGAAASVTTDQCPVRWVQVAPDTFSVVLADTCEALKGLSVTVTASEASWTVLPGALLTAQPGPWFLSQGPGGSRALFTVLGPEVGLQGHGEILRLVSDQPVTVSDLDLVLRDLHNQPLDPVVVGVADPGLIPATFAMAPPYPNPFNPRTTMAFDLPPHPARAPGDLRPHRTPGPPAPGGRPARRSSPGPLARPGRCRPPRGLGLVSVSSASRPLVGRGQAGTGEMMASRIPHLLCCSLLLLLATTALAQPTLRWDLPTDKLLVDDEAVLRVMLDDTVPVRTLELRVRFDPDVVSSVSGEPGQLFDGLDLYPGFTLTDGDTWYGYCVVLGADDWATGPGELFRWTIRGLAPGSSPLNAVDVALRPPGGGDYPDVTLAPAFIDVGDATITAAPPPTAPSLSIFPNPFNPRAGVTMVGQGPARLEVLDARGRLVATPWVGDLDSMARVAIWDGLDRQGRAMASGVYLFRLTDQHACTLQRGLMLR